MTPADLARHPKVEGAIDRLADRIRSNGGISIPREAIADLLATLLTVLRESEGPVLDFEAANQAGLLATNGDGSPLKYSKGQQDNLQAQHAALVAAAVAQERQRTELAEAQLENSRYDLDRMRDTIGWLRRENLKLHQDLASFTGNG